HDQPQSMSWCLDCHRNPENRLRPLDKITDLKWKPENDGKTQAEMGEKLKKNWHIEAPENCAACHR
ncbi:MAG: cytochrome C, partial [Verrucomicrobiales bacterium]|nr:cytochrome C [Verrucomicrobiales bacterium]